MPTWPRIAALTTTSLTVVVLLAGCSMPSLPATSDPMHAASGSSPSAPTSDGPVETGSTDGPSPWTKADDCRLAIGALDDFEAETDLASRSDLDLDSVKSVVEALGAAEAAFEKKMPESIENQEIVLLVDDVHTTIFHTIEMIEEEVGYKGSTMAEHRAQVDKLLDQIPTSPAVVELREACS